MDETKQLMLETLHEMKAYIPKVMEAIHGIVQNFQTEKEQDGITVFGPFTEGMQWMLQALSLTVPIQQEFDIEIAIHEIDEPLQEMLDGWENGDYILISDLLEYEIYPTLSKWSEELQKLS